MGLVEMDADRVKISDIVPHETVQRAISEFRDEGFCVLRRHLPSRVVNACRDAFWPCLLAYLQRGNASNRGPHRHFLPMPFERPCFAPELFFDPVILRIVRGLMNDRIVADQWGCDVPVSGSEYQRRTWTTSTRFFRKSLTSAFPRTQSSSASGWFRSRRSTGRSSLRRAHTA
jgi:hypothetical protein